MVLPWLGFPMSALIAAVEPKPEAKFVLQLKPVELTELCQQAVHGIQSYALRYQVPLELQLPQFSNIKWILLFWSGNNLYFGNNIGD